jgi:hypothetical protein
MPSQEQLLKAHLIEKYREFITKRYDYDVLKNTEDVPEEMTREIVDSLREYFLQYLYPKPEFREKLDEAFEQLSNYVSQPAKVWGLMGNLAVAIIKFGTQFPAALRAGLVALESHTAAKRFEKDLMECAKAHKFKTPFTDKQFLECIKSIPQPRMERFINELGHLFTSFTNSKLLGKTILIMKDVLERMKKRSDLYGPEEVEAIRLGIEVMQNGYDLFSTYDDSLKKKIVAYIIDSERRFIARIHSGEVKSL